MHFDVRHGNAWQIQLKRLPVRAVVEGDKHAKLSSRVEQSGTLRVFAHDARGPIGRDAVMAVSQTRPRFAVIISAIDVRFVIAEEPAIDGVVSTPSAMW